MASFMNPIKGLIIRRLLINIVSSPLKTPSTKFFPFIKEFLKKLLGPDI